MSDSAMKSALLLPNPIELQSTGNSSTEVISPARSGWFDQAKSALVSTAAASMMTFGAAYPRNEDSKFLVGTPDLVSPSICYVPTRTGATTAVMVPLDMTAIVLDKFQLRDRVSVEQFLRGQIRLVGELSAAHQKIRSLFPSNILRLDLLRATDEDADTLWIRIVTREDPAVSQQKLTILDEDWWLERYRAVGDVLSIDLEYV